MKESWVKYFMGLAEFVATKSKDPSTKVGCVVIGPHKEVRATGFNGFARRVEDTPERYEDRDTKLKMVVHAEANAVAAAARTGTSLYGCTVFTTMPLCTQCAALLMQAGVVKVVSPPIDEEGRWAELNHLAVKMCDEAGVRVEFYGQTD